MRKIYIKCLFLSVKWKWMDAEPLLAIMPSGERNSLRCKISAHLFIQKRARSAIFDVNFLGIPNRYQNKLGR